MILLALVAIRDRSSKEGQDRRGLVPRGMSTGLPVLPCRIERIHVLAPHPDDVAAALAAIEQKHKGQIGHGTDRVPCNELVDVRLLPRAESIGPDRSASPAEVHGQFALHGIVPLISGETLPPAHSHQWWRGRSG